MHSTAVPASRSRQNYLKALLQLGAGSPVPVSALARHLHVSAPSVTNMLARLAEERLVTLGARGVASPTPDGERAALLVLRRHRILEAFLVNVLELDWSDVDEDAEELEHHVSDRVLDALDRYMSHPKEDPHGHPIPDSRGRLARHWLQLMLAFAGPAYLVSVGYMDPGNWATDLAGGSRFGYQLVWVLVMSSLMAVLFQTLSARLGVVTGRDLVQACRDFYPRVLVWPLWIL